MYRLDNSYNSNTNENIELAPCTAISRQQTQTTTRNDTHSTQTPERGMLYPQMPQTLENKYYTPGYLKTQIGKLVRLEFLIGTTGPLIDRIGTLLDVGASYVLIQPIASNDTLLTDLYSIKFVTIYKDGLSSL